MLNRDAFCYYYDPFVVMFFFFFNDTATTEIYTLSLHDALPISAPRRGGLRVGIKRARASWPARFAVPRSEEHTLNSSHSQISYAVFCLKKKKRCSQRLMAPRAIWLSETTISVLPSLISRSSVSS